MEKILNNGQSVPGTDSQKRTPAPTRDQVEKWVKKDLASAHYLLGVLLTRYPDVVTSLAHDIYDHAMKQEDGAAIDHVVAAKVPEPDQDAL